MFELLFGLLLIPPIFFLLLHGSLLGRLWREPVLRVPVLNFESDDWGPAGELHAQRLQQVCALLAAHRDTAGRPAVMTIGVILANADTQAIRDDGDYARVDLLDERARAVREALLAGEEQGVLALQLHGMEHYWPASIMQASEQPEVAGWLQRSGLPDTEDLPSALQSRWADASTLPSQAHADEAVEQAVAEEVACYRQAFGFTPAVVVPPTFLWHENVAQAWASKGVKTLITPGRRFDHRDEQGKIRPVPGELYFNAETGPQGLLYLVRDSYLEPAMGHDAAQGMNALSDRSKQGRPCLLETHRFNFTGSAEQAEQSLAVLDEFLTQARRQFPEVAFLSSETLAEIYRRDDSEWLEHALGPRLRAFSERLNKYYAIRRFAWLSGVLPITTLLGRILP